MRWTDWDSPDEVHMAARTPSGRHSLLAMLVGLALLAVAVMVVLFFLRNTLSAPGCDASGTGGDPKCPQGISNAPGA
jgi:hypothetical protein